MNNIELKRAAEFNSGRDIFIVYPSGDSRFPWEVSMRDAKGEPKRYTAEGNYDRAGDMKLATLDDAIDVAQYELQRIEDARKEQERIAKAEQVESERMKLYHFDAFTSSMNPMQRAKAIATLDKQIRLNGLIYTLASIILTWHGRGTLRTKVIEENKYAMPNRRVYNRMTREQQLAVERRMREGGKKKVYFVCDGNDTYEMGKTAFDYATFIINNSENFPINDNNLKTSRCIG